MRIKALSELGEFDGEEFKRIIQGIKNKKDALRNRYKDIANIIIVCKCGNEITITSRQLAITKEMRCARCGRLITSWGKYYV